MPILRKYWFVATITIFITAILGGIGYMFWYGASSLPVISRAPEFTLTNVLTNQPVTLRSLDSKVKLVTFLYTRCPDECPTTAFHMQQLQNQLKKMGLFGSKVVFLSITFDPTHDTSPVLKQYANQFHADPIGWYWLRSDEPTTLSILRQFGVTVKKPSNEIFEHQLKTELLDQSGNVRKIYSTANLDQNEVIGDIQNLISRG